MLCHDDVEFSSLVSVSRHGFPMWTSENLSTREKDEERGWKNKNTNNNQNQPNMQNKAF